MPTSRTADQRFDEINTRLSSAQGRDRACRQVTVFASGRFKAKESGSGSGAPVPWKVQVAHMVGQALAEQGASVEDATKFQALSSVEVERCNHKEPSESGPSVVILGFRPTLAGLGARDLLESETVRAATAKQGSTRRVLSDRGGGFLSTS